MCRYFSKSAFFDTKWNHKYFYQIKHQRTFIYNGFPKIIPYVLNFMVIFSLYKSLYSYEDRCNKIDALCYQIYAGMSAKYFTEIILQNKNFLRKTRHRRARLTRLCSVFLRSLSALAACLDVIDNKISRRLALYWLKLTTLDMVEELTTPGTVKFILA